MEKKDFTAKLTSAMSLIAEKKLPANWINRIQPESGTSIEDQVKALETEFTNIRTGIINEAVAIGQFASLSGQMPDRTEEEWTKLMNGETPAGMIDLGIK